MAMTNRRPQINDAWLWPLVADNPKFLIPDRLNESLLVIEEKNEAKIVQRIVWDHD